MKPLNIATVYVTLFAMLIISDVCHGMDLPELWQTSLRNNYTLQQQTKLLERSEKEVEIQKTGYLPKLSTRAYGAWLFFNEPPAIFRGGDKDLTVNIFSLAIDQPIFTGFRTQNSITAAEKNFAAQALQKKITRNSIFLETGMLFYDIQSNLVQEEVLQSSVERINFQLTKIKNLLEADQVTAFDTLELANKKLLIQTQLSGIQGETRILFSKLKYMVNAQNLPEVSRPASAQIDLSLTNLATCYDLALTNRPEIQQISEKRSGQLAYSDVLRGAYYPVVSASGAYNKARLDGLVFDGSWIDLYSVFVTFQWELWAWNRDKKKVQQAQLDIQRIDLATQELKDNIRQQVKTAYQMLEITRDKIYLQNQLVEQETERFRQTRERYEQGLTTILDLNSAENDLTAAQLELEKTKILWHKNMLQLDFATGIIGNNMEEY
jgi:outer membrane protein